jgi:hypothetical protein
LIFHVAVWDFAANGFVRSVPLYVLNIRSGPYNGGMADSLRLELRVSRELLDRLDAARGSSPRGTWVKERLVDALGGVPLRSEADKESLRAVWESPELERQLVEVPSCPECAGDFVVRDGRWLCGDCGRPR